MERYKSGYMLETLANGNLLVYNLLTSKNGYPLRCNIGRKTISRKDFGKFSIWNSKFL